MAKTPESRIKDAVETRLRAAGILPASKAPEVTTAHTGWYFKPVSLGMGVHGICDIVGHYRGFFFSIETKVPGKNPTPLQQHQIRAINATGGLSLVVRCVEDLAWFDSWVQKVDLGGV